MEIIKQGRYAKVQIDPQDDEFLHEILTKRAQEASQKYNNQVPLQKFHISLNLNGDLTELLEPGFLAANLREEHEMIGYAYARVVRRVSVTGRCSTFIRFNCEAFQSVLAGSSYPFALDDWSIHPHISLTNLTGSPYDSVKAPYEEWVGNNKEAV